MTTSDWIILGAAILTGGGTLFLGIMAWRTIRQTRNLQKTEKRERLLNEIIEWATDIHSCNNPNVFRSWNEYFKEGWLEKDARKKWERLRIDESKEDFEVDREGALFAIQVNKDTSEIETRISHCIVEAEYIFNISTRFENDLYNVVKMLIIHLDAHEKLLYMALTQPGTKKVFLQRIAKHRPYLDQCAINVIREAAKIKTRDIG